MCSYIYIRALTVDRIEREKANYRLWPMNAVQSGSAAEETYAFRLDSTLAVYQRRRRGGTTTTTNGKSGAHPTAAPSLRRSCPQGRSIKNEISRDLTKEVLLPKGTTHVGGASHYFPINPQLSLT